jgi:hypothetical protein
MTKGNKDEAETEKPQTQQTDAAKAIKDMRRANWQQF